MRTTLLTKKAAKVVSPYSPVYNSRLPYAGVRENAKEKKTTIYIGRSKVVICN